MLPVTTYISCKQSFHIQLSICGSKEMKDGKNSKKLFISLIKWQLVSTFYRLVHLLALVQKNFTKQSVVYILGLGLQMGSELREVFNYHLLKLTEHSILK